MRVLIRSAFKTVRIGYLANDVKWDVYIVYVASTRVHDRSLFHAAMLSASRFIRGTKQSYATPRSVLHCYKLRSNIRVPADQDN